MTERTLIDEIAKSIGHKRLKFVWKGELRPNGSSIFTSIIRVRSFIDELRNVHIITETEPYGAPSITFKEIYKDCDEIEPSKSLDAHGYFFIFFKPKLESGKEAEFEIIEDYSTPIFLMTKMSLKEYRRKHPDPLSHSSYEYFLHTVSIPTDLLELTLIVPKDVKIGSDVFCMALRDPLGTPYPAESQRMEANFTVEKKEGLIASVRVSKPIFGISYGLFWEPV